MEKKYFALRQTRRSISGPWNSSRGSRYFYGFEGYGLKPLFRYPVEAKELGFDEPYLFESENEADIAARNVNRLTNSYTFASEYNPRDTTGF